MFRFLSFVAGRFRTTPSVHRQQGLNPFTRLYSTGANRLQNLQRWEVIETTNREGDYDEGVNMFNKLKDHSGEDARSLLCKNLGNCTTEQKIKKMKKKYKKCRFKNTEEYFIALIRGYTGSYLMDKAKKVIKDVENADDVNPDSVLAIKNFLICQLAPRREIDAALAISTELGNDTSAEAAISITHNLREKGQLHQHMKLLEYLDKAGPVAWYKGFLNTIFYCIQHRMLRETIDLISELHKKKFETDEILTQAFGILADTPDIDFALELYEHVKSITEIYTIRAILNSLQTCSMVANNRAKSDYVWSLYAKHNLEYNNSAYILRFKALYTMGDIEDAEKESILSLRAYQVKSVAKVLNNIRSKN